MDESTLESGDGLYEEEPEEAEPEEAEPEEDEPEEDEPEDADTEDTDFATVATGATVEEARRTALEQLRKVVPFVSDQDIEYVVVEQGTKAGFLGRQRSFATVEARVQPATERVDGDLAPATVELREFLERLVSLMGLEATIETFDRPEALVAQIGGDDLGILIGRHGQTIDALQYLAAIVVNRSRRSRRQVIVDAEGYRDRRAVSLHSLADRVAQQVARDRTAVTLKPMTAAERKVVHLRLKDNPRVETVSEGQEPNRAVVIVPKRSP